MGDILDNQAQIEKHCKVGDNGEWWHTASCHNAADQATRSNSSPLDLSKDSVWQQGPLYLRAPVSEWPINPTLHHAKRTAFHPMSYLKQFRCLIQMSKCTPSASIQDLVDPTCTNDWNKLIRFTQNLLKVYVTD